MLTHLVLAFAVLALAGFGLALGLLLRGRAFVRGCDGTGACGDDRAAASGGCGLARSCAAGEERP